jgi:hypothetical protein
MSATTLLNEEALRCLFLSGYNTYLKPIRFTKIVIDHPPHELFRPNGAYARSTGRTALEGTYVVEGNHLCVMGNGIPQQCRKVIWRGGMTYLLIDASDGSDALMVLSQVK